MEYRDGNDDAWDVILLISKASTFIAFLYITRLWCKKLKTPTILDPLSHLLEVVNEIFIIAHAYIIIGKGNSIDKTNNKKLNFNSSGFLGS